jgi:hypothetical protein
MAAEQFYVQVRDAAERRWVAVAQSADRRTGERIAASASRTGRDPHGRLPVGVRVMSSHDLEFEGGADAVTRAIADLREATLYGSTPR